jgi:bifunctional non-homologous end joining protein LigD
VRIPEADKPPGNSDWSTEVKFDGWRGQIVIDGAGARVFTRRGL